MAKKEIDEENKGKENNSEAETSLFCCLAHRKPYSKHFKGNQDPQVTAEFSLKFT